jgi:hypothetical protein
MYLSFIINRLFFTYENSGTGPAPKTGVCAQELLRGAGEVADFQDNQKTLVAQIIRAKTII